MVARVMSMPRRLVALILVLLGLCLAVPAVIVAQDVLTMDNEEQKDWLTSFVQDRLSTPERQIRLSNIDGVLGSDVSVREITISDQDGVWLRVNNATLNWNQGSLFLGRLEVRSLRADSIEYIRNAKPAEGVDLRRPRRARRRFRNFRSPLFLKSSACPR
jgi:translocation and assembly module TamB